MSDAEFAEVAQKVAARHDKIMADPRYPAVQAKVKALYRDGRWDEHLYPVDMIESADTLDDGFEWVNSEIRRLELMEPNRVLLA